MAQVTRRGGEFSHADDNRRDGNNMLTSYVRYRTDNNPIGAQSRTTMGWLSCIPEKSTPPLLCKSLTMRLMANSENVDSLSACDGPAAQSGRDVPGTHEGKKE
jgi:hypothetical protein